jgi:hypothetical protein
MEQNTDNSPATLSDCLAAHRSMMRANADACERLDAERLRRAEAYPLLLRALRLIASGQFDSSVSSADQVLAMRNIARITLSQNSR